MKMRWSLILIAAVAGAALAAVPQNAGPDGLVQVQSRALSEVYLRPSADLSAYRRILVDPPQGRAAEGLAQVHELDARRDALAVTGRCAEDHRRGGGGDGHGRCAGVQGERL